MFMFGSSETICRNCRFPTVLALGRKPVRLIPVAVIAVAATLGARLARREWRRVNEELDRLREGGRRIPTLRRDKATGEWRP
jgi:hypothetical protein